MLNYNLDIDSRSNWIITTKTSTAKSMPFYLTELGDFHAGKHYFTERDNKEGYQLLYTVSGAGGLTCGTQELALVPKTAVIVKCFEHHKYWTSGTAWHFRWIHFGGTGSDSLEAYINDGRFQIVPVTDPKQFESDFDFLGTLAPRNDVISCAQISNQISEMMTSMLTQRLSEHLHANNTPAHYLDIKTVTNFIHQNYQRQISIDEMTETVNISKYHFIRLFKKQMGTTPYEYLVNYRINQAKIMLRSTNKSVHEISYEVGYLSKSNFTAQFKALVGIPPARYRSESLHMST